MPESIIGLDEAGIGCWAGPLVVCAFFDDGSRPTPEVLKRKPPEGPPGPDWLPFRDSKQLSEKKRAEVAAALRAARRGDFTVVWRSAEEIDAAGVWGAWDSACNEAIDALIARVGFPDRVIVDGSRKPGPGAECVARADALVAAACMASVIAKTSRDEYMQSLKEDLYGFKNHVGYGTEEHVAALERYGVCPLHRRSFGPIQKVLAMAGAARVGCSP